MFRRRRIFRPAPAPRRLRAPLMALAGVLIVAGLSGIGLPPDLMGSAPREQDWSALAAEVRVVDGDTLRLGDRTLRLSGIDAPERGQSCSDAAGRWFDCGAAAAEALSRLVNGRSVLCRVHGRDRFGRGLGRCTAGGAELNTGLVTAGWALAYADDDVAMRLVETEARLAGRGLWAGNFTRPDAWRRRN
ncbi:thermonuclease family protein [Falsiroseomonas sp.]|uniref:thermonuclease family protein n=1 Tax=Falsiroseomonas sp. TaxID=2870721 RepID=UPI00272191BD|nr:thermonuclease family protein [Falsiroseomonas sp.]MDO9498574.1 thermonuclease family protein [Falsiroseomonas sp.]MDP3417772.1 thermonuclease family protein [Falsiroseomonas sp.]